MAHRKGKKKKKPLGINNYSEMHGNAWNLNRNRFDQNADFFLFFSTVFYFFLFYIYFDSFLEEQF